MLIDISNGYDTGFINIEKLSLRDNGFYRITTYAHNTREPYLSCELISVKFAKDLLKNGKNAKCLCGDGSKDDIWCRPEEDGTVCYACYGYEDVIEAITDRPDAKTFIQSILDTKPQKLYDFMDYIRLENNSAVDMFLMKEYGLTDDDKDMEFTNKLIAHCNSNIEEICELYLTEKAKALGYEVDEFLNDER